VGQGSCRAPCGRLPMRQVVIADGPHPPVELVTIAATLERGWSSPAVPSACPGATSGPHPTRQQRTTPSNNGHSTSQLQSPSRPASQVVRPPRFSLARRKPGVQIPSPPPHMFAGHRPSGVSPLGRRRSRVSLRAANGQQLRTTGGQDTAAKVGDFSVIRGLLHGLGGCGDGRTTGPGGDPDRAGA
jgi:hypothetical protein